MRLILALLIWVALCAYALHDAGAPYQCTTDTQCELLHGE